MYSFRPKTLHEAHIVSLGDDLQVTIVLCHLGDAKSYSSVSTLKH